VGDGIEKWEGPEGVIERAPYKIGTGPPAGLIRPWTYDTLILCSISERETEVLLLLRPESRQAEFDTLGLKKLNSRDRPIFYPDSKFSPISIANN